MDIAKSAGISPPTIENFRDSLRNANEMANNIEMAKLRYNKQTQLSTMLNPSNPLNKNNIPNNPTLNIIDQAKKDLEQDINNSTQLAIDQAKKDFEQGINNPTQLAIDQAKKDFGQGINNPTQLAIDQAKKDFEQGINNPTQLAIDQAKKDLSI